MLFINRHGSHVNMRFLTWANKHKILVAVYPPHSTHRLQPLDVSLFNPLANFYSQELNKWIFNTGGRCRITKREFYGLFKPAFKCAITKKDIESGWTKTGLYPFNLEVVLGPLRPLERALTRNSESSKSSAFSAENI
jgi:hypothetical protein